MRCALRSACTISASVSRCGRLLDDHKQPTLPDLACALDSPTPDMPSWLDIKASKDVKEGLDALNVLRHAHG